MMLWSLLKSWKRDRIGFPPPWYTWTQKINMLLDTHEVAYAKSKPALCTQVSSINCPWSCVGGLSHHLLPGSFNWRATLVQWFKPLLRIQKVVGSIPSSSKLKVSGSRWWERCPSRPWRAGANQCGHARSVGSCYIHGFMRDQNWYPHKQALFSLVMC